jgi:ABC-type Zn2+ transport system substrate-binding protein/surface adhesin
LNFIATENLNHVELSGLNSSSLSLSSLRHLGTCYLDLRLKENEREDEEGHEDEEEHKRMDEDEDNEREMSDNTDDETWTMNSKFWIRRALQSCN